MTILHQSIIRDNRYYTCMDTVTLCSFNINIMQINLENFKCFNRTTGNHKINLKQLEILKVEMSLE